MPHVLAANAQEGTFSVILLFGLFALIANLIVYFRGFYTLPLAKDSRCITFLQTSVCIGVYLLNSFFLSPFIFVFLINPILRKAAPHLATNPNIVNTLFQALVIFLNLFLLFLYLQSQKRREVKALFKDPAMKESSSYFSDILIGVFTWFISFPVVVTINQICQWINIDLLKIEPIDQVAVRFLKMSSGSYFTFAFAIFFIIITAPVIEEFIFRGCIQNFIRQKIGAKASIILTALIFAFMHFSLSQKESNFPLIASLFTLSLYLGFIYEKTRSLLAPMTLHMVFNGVNVLRLVLYLQAGE